ncbi:hypothetical protein COLO4_17191 [Corchorus olitorius]|uniref:Uncharacterized protein n=1 Tax=Corchorus olitorius TaxID=93759 RepID=A0A1R3JDP9_9ROSI|nr:hypothetical protein COLO4_17191 [Corchorus olitorius]
MAVHAAQTVAVATVHIKLSYLHFNYQLFQRSSTKIFIDFIKTYHAIPIPKVFIFKKGEWMLITFMFNDGWGRGRCAFNVKRKLAMETTISQSITIWGILAYLARKRFRRVKLEKKRMLAVANMVDFESTIDMKVQSTRAMINEPAVTKLETEMAILVIRKILQKKQRMVRMKRVINLQRSLST